ncbi:MAG: MgtC/SapB family protein [Treponema sp.]|jgi:putative Mg2+ transporter-C (MgtC) family protein|nr:MgtC/SapB family protein [Treponema sp.]
MNITEMDIIIRLGAGFLAGAVIGLERSSRRQVAGLRTHILITIGATLLMLLSIWLPQQGMGGGGDPGRIAAQVVSGIGFLGAGAIIRLGNNIKGLTTAASLWLAAGIGLTIGAGLFIAAITAEVLALISLVVLGYLEKYIFPSERNKFMELTFKNNTIDTQRTLDIISSFGIRIQSTDLNQVTGKSGKDKGAKLRLFVGIPSVTDIAKVARTLKDSGVDRVEIKEKY